jgi:hypothetical protein
MSYSTIVYLGIFLEVKYPIVEIEEIHYVDDNGRKFTEPFNPKTGKALRKVVKINKEKNFPHADIEDNDSLDPEAFRSVEYHSGPKYTAYFILNSESKYLYSINPENADDTIEIKEPINPQELINDFKLEYKKYLDYYKDHYKYEFEVKYGLFSITL